MIDYRIQTFLTLCDTMNYRAAAERLNITQPSVTQHIQYLEKYYQCKLFTYNGRTLSMTPEAAILKKYANSMNYQEFKLQQALKPDKGYSLRIGATKTIGEYVIPSQVANFLADPANTISVEVDNTKRILDLLDQGKLDFALIEGYFSKSTYASRLYRNEPFVGFCSNTHPFANKTIPLSDIFHYDLIVRESGSGTRDVLEQFLSEHNYSIQDFRRTICVNHFGLLESLVVKNCGITFAYQAAGKNHPSLASFCIDDSKIFREFNYVYLPNTDAEILVNIFHSYA